MLPRWAMCLYACFFLNNICTVIKSKYSCFQYLSTSWFCCYGNKIKKWGENILIPIRKILHKLIESCPLLKPLYYFFSPKCGITWSFEWTPCSADLNPKEDVWDEIDKRVKQLPKPKDLAEHKKETLYTLWIPSIKCFFSLL